MSGVADSILEDVHSCNILSLAIPQAGLDGTQVQISREAISVGFTP